MAADTFFEAAKDAANLPETALRRFWLITFDGRTCPICRGIPALNEDGKLFNEPFLTSEGPYLRPASAPAVSLRGDGAAHDHRGAWHGGATAGACTPRAARASSLPTPPPKVKKPAKPKKPKAAPVPPPPADE